MNKEAFKEKVKRNVAQNFDQSISIYQEFEAQHGFFEALALKMAENIGLTNKAAVLDIGCGYGLSARVLAQRYGCRVLGVDLSSQMVAAGRVFCEGTDIQLHVGDGENLSPVVAHRRFDYALYNASIFIFPDVSKALAESCACLRPGGKIAFSFYPELLGNENEDLFAQAFDRLGEPMPRFRVITGFKEACEALGEGCRHIRRHHWVRPLDISFLQDFFSIPAQSTSLFPGRNYEKRRDLVMKLFDTLEDMAGNGRIVWRMAEGVKPKASS